MEGLLVVSGREGVRIVKAERKKLKLLERKERIMFSLKIRSQLLQIYFCTGSFHSLHWSQRNLSSFSVASDSTNNIYGACFTALLPGDSQSHRADRNQIKECRLIKLETMVTKRGLL